MPMWQKETAWTSFVCGCVWVHEGPRAWITEGEDFRKPTSTSNHSAALLLCLCSCHLATATKPSLPSSSWAACLWSTMKQHKLRVSAACALPPWSPISDLNWVGWETVLQDFPFPDSSRDSKPSPNTSSYPRAAFKLKSKPKQEVSAPLLDPKARFPIKHFCFTPNPIQKAALDRKCLQAGDMKMPWGEFVDTGASLQHHWALCCSGCNNHHWTALTDSDFHSLEDNGQFLIR